MNLPLLSPRLWSIVFGTLLPTAAAFALDPLTSPKAFDYTGTVQTFTVPPGVTGIHIDASGAQGGGSFGGAGGKGARMTGDFSVTPGQVLSIVVGQQGLLQVGGNVQNSSGGGGGSFVYLDGTTATLLVAAGGGGGKCNYSSSGPLHEGANGQVTTSGQASSDGGAAGGTDGNGGAAGLFNSSPCSGGGTGWLTSGGGPYGGSGYSSWTGGTGFSGGGGGGAGGVGGYGGGGGGGNHYGGGGGGGGYSGGGGGTDPTHGGGGGSYSSGVNQDNEAGYKTGDGQVIITWPVSINNPPTKVGSGVPDQLLSLSGGAVTMDLDAYFTDADVGDTLSYSVSANTFPGFATASISTGHFLSLTPLALGTTQVTLHVQDDAKSTGSVDHTFTVTVGTAGPTLTVTSAAKLNNQTGLLEMKVKVKNTMGRDISGFSILVTNLPSKYKLWNATTLWGRDAAPAPVRSASVKATKSDALVSYPASVAVDGEVVLTLEFFSPTRSFGSYRPTFFVTELLGVKEPRAIGEGKRPTRVKVQADGSVLLTFASKPGRRYQIVYSDDAGRSWRLSPVAIKAAATSVSWIDRGPPYTMTLPTRTRLYLIQEVPSVR